MHVLTSKVHEQSNMNSLIQPRIPLSVSMHFQWSLSYVKLFFMYMVCTDVLHVFCRLCSEVAYKRKIKLVI